MLLILLNDYRKDQKIPTILYSLTLSLFESLRLCNCAALKKFQNTGITFLQNKARIQENIKFIKSFKTLPADDADKQDPLWM